ncbi:glycoside hydrolase superfamily [Geopyxis carbonaria]|nr:glycoside hydrolase superfamily [Geopyxis carbonaria]
MTRFINLLAAGLLAAASAVDALSLKLASNEGNVTDPLKHGLMFEDINRSGDGGLYAELIRNRGLQGSSPSTKGYTALSGETITVDSTVPLSKALPRSLRVATSNATAGGFKNTGYYGMDIKRGNTYKGSFYAKGDGVSKFHVSLASEDDGTVWASKDIAAKSTDGWSKYDYQLRPSKSAPSVNNSLAITWEGADTVWFQLVSLFPPTFNNRENGLRVDIMEALQELGMSFLRFPGGNNLEGEELGNQWKWNETIGPLIDRPGRQGTWNYDNSDGLGLIEYLQWCDDLHLEPLLGIWAGFYLNGPTISEADLQPYIDDALAELEFITGPATSKYGALRASLGYPKPWTIRYVEIGNEDNLGGGKGSYSSYRFRLFEAAIKAAYPSITVMASTTEISPIPANAWLDYHIYGVPSQLVKNFNFFDHANRSHPIVVGEYAYIQDGSAVDWNAPKAAFSTLQGAVSEAVYMLGLERNADIVRGAAYAPVLQNLAESQWSPDLISFTANTTQTVRSMSYHVQKLFSLHRGDIVLPLDASDAAFDPLFWSASRSTDSREYVLKVVNYDGEATTVEFEVPRRGVRSGALHQLTAPAPDSVNELDKTASVVTEKRVAARNGKFSFEMAPWEVAVLVMT